MGTTHPRTGAPMNDNHSNLVWNRGLNETWGEASPYRARIVENTGTQKGYPKGTFSVSVAKKTPEEDGLGLTRLHEGRALVYRTQQRAEWAAQALVNRHERGETTPYAKKRNKK